MSSSKNPIKITIKKYISDEKKQILKLIDKHHRILLQSNPATGKTYFFKELAQEILKSNRVGRLIFAAPFLVISDQFINDLKSIGVTVDFKLWGESKRKLEPSDKVITSTLQSFHHIVDELNENDIVIIDEAHVLFYNYHQQGGTFQFYDRAIQNLYHTKAKVVLMSGTPNLSLLSMLNLTHIKIFKPNEIKARITIEYTNHDPDKISKAFALDTIRKNGNKKLNIIYIKNIGECIKIGQMLNDLGYKAEVTTSKNKESDIYNNLIEKSIIPPDIQFLVTTNVISTGANINNTNIGEALMINEFSALEIKQFSKRFRNKLDIEVTVVNLIFVPDKKKIKMTPTLIQKQRKYLKEQLDYFKNVEQNSNYDFDYIGNFYESKELGTPKDLSNTILKRYLIQESFFIDEAINLNDKPIKLAKELNKYTDIKATVGYDYVLANKMHRQLLTINDKIKHIQNLDKKVEGLINHFQQNIDEYHSVLCYDPIINKYQKYNTKRIIGSELNKEFNHSKKVIGNITSLLFNHEILPIFNQYREYFRSTYDFLEYLKHIDSQKEKNILPYTLMINEIFHKYFEVEVLPGDQFKSIFNIKQNNNILPTYLKSEIQLAIVLIETTYNYAINKTDIRIEELKDHLTSNNEVFEALKKVENYYYLPQVMYIGDKKIINPVSYNTTDSTSINTINTPDINFKSNNFIKSLLEGIFYAPDKRVINKGDKKLRHVLHESPPKALSGKKLNPNSTQLRSSSGEIMTIHWGTSKQGKEIKHLNTYELIMNDFCKN